MPYIKQAELTMLKEKVRYLEEEKDKYRFMYKSEQARVHVLLEQNERLEEIGRKALDARDAWGITHQKDTALIEALRKKEKCDGSVCRCGR